MDLDSRLSEIQESIALRLKSRDRQIRQLNETRESKKLLDDRLNEELRTYDSAFLSQARAVERQIATLQQELLTLRRDARIPEALQQMELEADKHQLNARELRREVLAERAKLSDQSSLIQTLEMYFYEALRAVGFPALTQDDTIYLHRRKWQP